MPHWTLGKLLEGLAVQRFGGGDEVTVHGLAIDSRRVAPGELFIALPSPRADPAGYAAAAWRRGACALILPQGVAPPPLSRGAWGTDTRSLLATLACRFYGHPSRRLWVAGVTGTNGKTTVVSMLAHILRQSGRPTALWSTHLVDSGARRFRPQLTTPEAHDLQSFLAEAVASGHCYACLEVSSHGVVQQRIAGLQLRAAAVTNVTADHLDFHGSVAAYRAAKRRFVQGLPPEAVVVVNRDDAGAQGTAVGAGAQILSYSLHREAAIWAKAPASGPTAAHCQVQVRAAALPPGLSAKDGSFTLQLPLSGLHNLSNALCAIGLSLVAGIPVAEAVQALAGFSPPPRRLQILQVGTRIIVDDLSMNRAGCDAVLATVAAWQPRQVIVVFALRGHRGPEANAAIAQCLAHWRNRLPLASVRVSLSRTALEPYGPELQVRPEEAAAFAAAAEVARLPFTLHAELAEAVAAAAAELGPRGVLLLLGTFGMDAALPLAASLLGAADTPPAHPLPQHP